MKSDGSYQKLQNEDTLSTISFQPPQPVKKQFDRRVGTRFLLAVIIAVSTLLILCHFLVGYHIISIHSDDERTEYWNRFYRSNRVPQTVDTALCPVLADIVDSREYKDSVSIMMHRKLTRENLPKGYEKSPAMKMVKTAYETCRTGTEDLAPLDEMIKSIEASILQNSTMADIADTVAALQSNFGVDTFFKFQVMANFQEPDGKVPYAIYISPNSELANIPYAEFLAKKSLNLRASRVNDVDLRFSWDLRNIVADAKAENSSNWQIFDLKDFEMSDDSFDFKTYVKTLTVDMPNLDLDSIKVVVTDPAYVERIVALVKEQQTPTAVLKNFFLKTLRISILADFDDCMQALENYVPHAATVIYLSIMKDADVEAARQKLYKTFEQTVEEMENIVGKYLSNDRQKRLAKEKLEKVGLSAEEPEWLQLENAVANFDLKHKDLQIAEHNSGLVSILRMRRFAFGNAIAHLNDKTEALRKSAFENVAESKTTMEYSRIGNWIHIPVASFMDIDEQRVVIKMAQEIAEILVSESFKWSPYGTQRPKMPYCKKVFMPANIVGQEQCFRYHGIDETDFSAVVGLEAAYRVLLRESKDPFAQQNLASELAKKMASDGSVSKTTIAAGFLNHINASDQCHQKNILPCFF